MWALLTRTYHCKSVINALGRPISRHLLHARPRDADPRPSNVATIDSLAAI